MKPNEDEKNKTNTFRSTKSAADCQRRSDVVEQRPSDCQFAVFSLSAAWNCSAATQDASNSHCSDIHFQAVLPKFPEATSNTSLALRNPAVATRCQRLTGLNQLVDGWGLQGCMWADSGGGAVHVKEGRSPLSVVCGHPQITLFSTPFPTFVGGPPWCPSVV